MFSHLGKDGYEASRQPYENLLDVLQRAGLAVLWIDTQSGCKGLCDRVAHVDTYGLKTPGLCVDGECFDDVMLQGLDQRIATLDPARRARGVVLQDRRAEARASLDRMMAGRAGTPWAGFADDLLFTESDAPPAEFDLSASMIFSRQAVTNSILRKLTRQQKPTGTPVESLQKRLDLLKP